MKIKIKGQEIDVKVCNWFERFSGLMFCRRESARALLFEFKKPTRIRIHSMFVFFPFIVVWINEDGKILDLKIVKSWSLAVSSRKSFSKLVEIPLTKKYEKIIGALLKEYFSSRRG